MDTERNLSTEWACPICETINTGGRCIICDLRKEECPTYYAQRAYLEAQKKEARVIPKKSNKAVTPTTEVTPDFRVRRRSLYDPLDEIDKTPAEEKPSLFEKLAPWIAILLIGLAIYLIFKLSETM